jgi:hypothetical protein
MKRKGFLFIALFSLVTAAFPQDLISSRISIGIHHASSPTVYVSTDGFFALNSNTQEFKCAINLFPIVPSPDVQDSLAMQSRPLQLTLAGQFAGGDISFLTAQDNDRTYSMPCTCKVYDSAKSCTIYFRLFTFANQPEINTVGGSLYQARLSFEMMINPSDYGLDFQPFAINEPILVVVQNAVLNKVAM